VLNISPKTKDAYDLFHEGSLALADVMSNGICVDVDYFKKQQKKLTKHINRSQEKIKESAIGKACKKKFGKVDLDSNLQLEYVLFDYCKLESSKKTKKGNSSTDASVLEKFSKEVPELKHLMDMRKLSKCRDTFVKGILDEQVDGVLHPFFSLNLVNTFRSQSNNINFQNIPNRDKVQKKIIREGFVPSIGNHLTENDIGGAEVKVALCYHQDPVMEQYLLDPTKDMHRDVAADCYKLDLDEMTSLIRYCGKNKFTFPAFYGSYFKQMSPSLWEAIPDLNLTTKSGTPMLEHLKSVGMRSYESFEKHIEKIEKDFWGRRFKVYGKWKKDWYKLYEKRGYFDSLTGFRFAGIMKRNEVINYPVQGSAFHSLLWTLIRVNDWLKTNNMESLIVGQIHDSLVGDIAPHEKIAYMQKVKQTIEVDIMKEWDWIIAPLEMEGEITPVDGSWFEKEACCMNCCTILDENEKCPKCK